MTSHQFAQKLLAGPDLPIHIPLVKEYQESDADGEEGVALSWPDVREDEVNFEPGRSLILVAQKTEAKSETPWADGAAARDAIYGDLVNSSAFDV